jgi:chemotaxis protein MotB
MEPGKSVKPAPGQMGPGGASSSPINLGGGLDAPKTSLQKTDKIGATVMTETAKPIDLKTEEQKAAEAAELERQIEKQQLDALMQDLKEAINKSQALEPFKDQLLLDLTPEGLRIQIVDQDRESMFPVGSSRMPERTRQLLGSIAQVMNKLPNRVSITGHTDATPYRSENGYGNWELSSDRANASRRMLIESGIPAQRVVQVAGKADTEPLFPTDPFQPGNRRIAIVLLRNAQSAPGSVVR